ncbi:hypothetical protein [Pseudomonas sp. LP_7_YM]|uniref:hypothetical protein n=1 Tax=Pseudomonas sp. LP_7_YM TaxID=2485137 RepID=UPI00105C5AE2|nr:hypothetical protein [Pseudomonas sp. LP_7_YM]TDV58961.1 hypothetical protein EC915_12112 [Pseudomonas sp. LP_7_YM]
MSVITIVLAPNFVNNSALMKFHRVLGIPVQALKHAWSNGDPILELEIFEGDYQAHAESVRAVLRIISDEGLSAEYFEIPYGERYAGNPKLNVWKIDAELVNGILNAADEEVERQLDS